MCPSKSFLRVLLTCLFKPVTELIDKSLPSFPAFSGHSLMNSITKLKGKVAKENTSQKRGKEEEVVIGYQN